MSQMVGDIGYPVLNQFLFQLSLSLSSTRSLIFTLIPTPIPLHKPYISSDVTPYHIVPIHPSTNQPPSVSPSIAVNSLQPGHVLVQYNWIPSFSFLISLPTFILLLPHSRYTMADKHPSAKAPKKTVVRLIVHPSPPTRA